VEFNNPRWIAEASVALERYDYVQPYDTACWLGPGLDRSKCIMTKTSFGYKRRHPGFAGGFRRDFLRRIGGGFLGDYVITGTMSKYGCMAQPKPLICRWWRRINGLVVG
jgi:hypothetical protein